MQNSNLIQLLRTLTPAEFREFREFIHSPVFNKNKNIKVLFDAIRKFYPSFNQKNLDNLVIFRKIFPSEKFDYFKLKNLTSDLFGLGKEFLSFSIFNSKKDMQGIYLLEQLRDRNLDNIFEKTIKTLKEDFEEGPVLDEFYVLRNLQLTEEMHSFMIPKDPETGFHFLQSELDLFLRYSVIRLLKFYNVMQHEMEQNNCLFELKLFDEIMNHVKLKKDEDNPTLLIYYNIILLSINKDEKFFYELKKLKNKYFKNLNNQDRYMIFLHLANFCAYNFNVLGKKSFMKEHFLLSKENFDKGTIILGKILYPDFLNHVKIAARVNEYAWAEKYIKKYENLLCEEKENTLNFCHGYISYMKGDLDKALELLSKTGFSTFIIKVQVKLLLLQINYEKGYLEQVLAMIDAFRHYLSREGHLLKAAKESYYEYLRILSSMTKVRYSVKGIDKEIKLKKIKSDIRNLKSNQFGIKNWLNERAWQLIIDN